MFSAKHVHKLVRYCFSLISDLIDLIWLDQIDIGEDVCCLFLKKTEVVFVLRLLKS